jgi:hypothetical protein
MDVISTEQGIRLGFVKTSEFNGGAEPPPPLWYATVPGRPGEDFCGVLACLAQYRGLGGWGLAGC